jgi:hypothetical protein
MAMATEQLSRHCPLVQRAAGVAVWVSLRLCHAARSGRGARADWAPASLRPLRYMKRKSDRRHSICRAAFVFGGMVRVHMTWRALGLAAGRRVRSGRSGRSVRCRLHGDTRRWRGAFAPSRSILTVLLSACRRPWPCAGPCKDSPWANVAPGRLARANRDGEREGW